MSDWESVRQATPPCTRQEDGAMASVDVLCWGAWDEDRGPWHCFVGHISNGKWYSSMTTSEHYVSHWMALPKPPPEQPRVKKEDEDDS